MRHRRPATCPGPIVWFDAPPGRPGEEPAAVLECQCGDYIVTTGNLHDARHEATPLMREGMAA